MIVRSARAPGVRKSSIVLRGGPDLPLVLRGRFPLGLPLAIFAGFFMLLPWHFQTNGEMQPTPPFSEVPQDSLAALVPGGRIGPRSLRAALDGQREPNSRRPGGFKPPLLLGRVSLLPRRFGRQSGELRRRRPCKLVPARHSSPAA